MLGRGAKFSKVKKLALEIADIAADLGMPQLDSVCSLFTDLKEALLNGDHVALIASVSGESIKCAFACQIIFTYYLILHL